MRSLTVVAVLVLAGLISTQPADASSAPVLPHRPPTALYPAGTTFKVIDPLSNFDKSCLWDLNCSDGATPVTHSTDEDALGRLGGWLVFAEWHGKHGRQMTFTLFASTYDSPAHAAAAAADYQAQVIGQRFQLTPFSCPSSVTGAAGTQYCGRYHDRSSIGGHYLSVSAAEGNVEIEMMTYANARYPDFRRFTFAQAQATMELSGD